MGRGSSLHAIILLGRMRKAIARIREEQLSQRKLAGIPLWEPALPAREQLCSPPTTHRFHCALARQRWAWYKPTSQSVKPQHREEILCPSLFVTQKRTVACWHQETHFFSFFFGFHCHFSSVERGRHSGSSCICFHYWQEENFHFPTELKVQEPAQFPSITSESFSLDHLLSWWPWEGNQEGQSSFPKQKALS